MLSLDQLWIYPCTQEVAANVTISVLFLGIRNCKENEVLSTLPSPSPFPHDSEFHSLSLSQPWVWNIRIWSHKDKMASALWKQSKHIRMRKKESWCLQPADGPRSLSQLSTKKGENAEQAWTVAIKYNWTTLLLLGCACCGRECFKALLVALTRSHSLWLYLAFLATCPGGCSDRQGWPYQEWFQTGFGWP